MSATEMYAREQSSFLIPSLTLLPFRAGQVQDQLALILLVTLWSYPEAPGIDSPCTAEDGAHNTALLTFARQIFSTLHRGGRTQMPCSKNFNLLLPLLALPFWPSPSLSLTLSIAPPLSHSPIPANAVGLRYSTSQDSLPLCPPSVSPAEGGLQPGWPFRAFHCSTVAYEVRGCARHDRSCPSAYKEPCA